MLKKRRILKAIKVSLVITLCLLIGTSGISVDASSGKLKGASIINCNGTNYGHHGDGHWHKATKHDAGWYPNGENLGYSNPCGGSQAAPKSSVVKESAADKAKREQAAREAEEKKQAEAAAREAERLENERLAEEARIKAEAEEAERIRLENIRLNDVSIQEVVVDGNTLPTSSAVLLMDYRKNLDLVIKTKNENASSVATTSSKREAFKVNDIVVNVISENGEIEKSTMFSFFDLGSKEELLKQKVSIIYTLNSGTESISLNETTSGLAIDFGTLSSSDVSNIVINAININGHVIQLDEKHLVRKDSIQFDQLSNFNFEINGIDYSLPFYVSKPSSAPLIFSSVGVVSGLGVFSYSKRRKKK